MFLGVFTYWFSSALDASHVIHIYSWHGLQEQTLLSSLLQGLDWGLPTGGEPWTLHPRVWDTWWNFRLSTVGLPSGSTSWRIHAGSDWSRGLGHSFKHWHLWDQGFFPLLVLFEKKANKLGEKLKKVNCSDPMTCLDFFTLRPASWWIDHCILESFRARIFLVVPSFCFQVPAARRECTGFSEHDLKLHLRWIILASVLRSQGFLV